MVGGLTIHLLVANCLRFIWAKNYENWLRVGKVIAKKAVCSFFWPTLYSNVSSCPLNKKCLCFCPQRKNPSVSPQKKNMAGYVPARRSLPIQSLVSPRISHRPTSCRIVGLSVTNYCIKNLPFTSLFWHKEFADYWMRICLRRRSRPLPTHPMA